jgi:NodT family efflux transporter outer membrane factor (OMF) lipoprotein
MPSDADSRGPWWISFRDPPLEALESRVTDANQDLRAALARLQEARARTRIAQSNQYPIVAATAGAARTKASVNSPTYDSKEPATYSDFTAGVNLSYEVDLFGRVRNTIAGARDTEQATVGDVATLELSLQADLANNYFELCALDAQQELLDRTVNDYQRALTLTEALHNGGLAPVSDVQQAETQFESARTQAEDNRLRRAQTEHAIAILVGEQPSRFALPFEPLAADTTPPPIDLGLPSQLLERRPDVAAAERRVAAANASIGVARTAYFPVISLAGAAGTESFSLSDLMLAPSHFWSVGPQALVTLFDGGLRRAQTAGAAAAYDATVANYRGIVLTAFQEVEDNLAALRQLERENLSQADAVASAQGALDQANFRYRSGLVTYLDVVSTENAALSARVILLNIQARRLKSSILLIKALGGGWGAATDGTDKGACCVAPASTDPTSAPHQIAPALPDQGSTTPGLDQRTTSSIVRSVDAASALGDPYDSGSFASWRRDTGTPDDLDQLRLREYACISSQQEGERVLIVRIHCGWLVANGDVSAFLNETETYETTRSQQSQDSPRAANSYDLSGTFIVDRSNTKATTSGARPVFSKHGDINMLIRHMESSAS